MTSGGKAVLIEGTVYAKPHGRKQAQNTGRHKIKPPTWRNPEFEKARGISMSHTLQGSVAT